MTDVIEQMQQLGFSQYEAQAYIALLISSPLNGYELAKASGIPRPNIYAVLRKLEERGAVLRSDSPDGARYAPTPPQELLARLDNQVRKNIQTTACALEEISAPPSFEYILNLRGYPALIDNARALLDAATERLTLSVWPEEAGELVDNIQQAGERGVEITTLCLRGCGHPCPACQGTVFRYPIAPVGGGRWLIVIADERELLAGEIGADGSTQAVRTRQRMMVNLSGSYIQNSIALASIVGSLGERLDDELDPQVLAAINTLHPMHSAGTGQAVPWLDGLREMINPAGSQPVR